MLPTSPHPLRPLHPWPSLQKTARGITLLEILLALAIGALVSAAAVPAVSGWISERQFRNELSRLAEEVATLRRQAEESALSFTLWLGSEKDLPTPLRNSNPPRYEPRAGFRLLREARDGRWLPASGTPLRIQAGGIVEPSLLRLEKDGNYIVFRFDPFTGFLREEAFQF